MRSTGSFEKILCTRVTINITLDDDFEGTVPLSLISDITRQMTEYTSTGSNAGVVQSQVNFDGIHHEVRAHFNINIH